MHMQVQVLSEGIYPSMQWAEVGKAGLKKTACSGKRSGPAIAIQSFTRERFSLLPWTLERLETTQYEVVR